MVTCLERVYDHAWRQQLLMACTLGGLYHMRDDSAFTAIYLVKGLSVLFLV